MVTTTTNRMLLLRLHNIAMHWYVYCVLVSFGCICTSRVLFSIVSRWVLFAQSVSQSVTHNTTTVCRSSVYTTSHTSHVAPFPILVCLPVTVISHRVKSSVIVHAYSISRHWRTFFLFFFQIANTEFGWRAFGFYLCVWRLQCGAKRPLARGTSIRSSLYIEDKLRKQSAIDKEAKILSELILMWD